MSRPVFNSVFADHITLFLDFREMGGVKYMYPDFFHLKKLDVFFLQEGLTEISFSKDQAIK
jgi:integrase/recombinase XerD